MTFRGEGGYPRDVKDQKCMHKPILSMKIVTLRRGEGFLASHKNDVKRTKISLEISPQQRSVYHFLRIFFFKSRPPYQVGKKKRKWMCQRLVCRKREFAAR